MKAILGVDSAGSYRRAENLLVRLRLPEMQVEAVSVVEPMLPDMSWPALSEGHPLKEAGKLREDAADAALKEASERLNGLGFRATTHREVGNPAHVLEARAEQERANIIAAGSERKGRFGSLFLGSVTKGLCTGARTNVLIAKNDAASLGGIHAVFATDLSEYAYRCVDELLFLNPQGLSRVTVLTAYGVDEGFRSDLLPDDPALEEFTPVACQNRSETAARRIAERFKALSVPVDVVAVEDEANHAIEATMRSTGAELLILGDQGKNFLQRLTLGSTAMHEVINGNHNLLLLKPHSRSTGDMS
jgi:nucleotide-binding universal stress UspA family protein